MKKISTLFKKDPNDLGRVVNEIDPQNMWVYDNYVRATQKFDGTACAIINGELYKRYNVKKGKSVPENAIPCQDADEITGHWPHWVKCDRSDNANKYHFEAFDKMDPNNKIDATYELCGPKIQGNPEGLTGHELIIHGFGYGFPMEMFIKSDFKIMRSFLEHINVEGIVFCHPDGRMCKIRKSDFGLKR